MSEGQQRTVWQVPKAGSMSRLAQQTDTMGALPVGHIRVSVGAVGLNFADLFAITGLYSATPSGSFIPGLEFAGTVLACGDGVSGYAVGDRVMGAIRFGAYATILDADARCCAKVPDDWSLAQGAAYLVQTFTAYYALTDLGSVRQGHTVLVHSAAGGVGLQAMRICKALGAVPIGTVGHASKLGFLAEQGFEEAFVRDGQFAQRLHEALKDRPLQLVLDAIGGQIQKASFKALAPMGRLVTFGAAQYTPGKKRPRYLKALWQWLTRPKYDALAMISRNQSVMGFNLIWLWQNIALFEDMLQAMDALRLPPPHVGHHFAFDDAADALECLRGGRTVGKVVLYTDKQALSS